MYTLPKIWKARVSRYWDKYIPVDYPKTDAKFDVKFDTDEEKDAVATFESELNTEESVVAPIIGEENFVSNYFGTYDVKCDTDTTDPILLSPEKIVTDDEIAAFHYNTKESKWEQIEDATLKDGYAYGTLTGFSPVAIIAYKKDIEVVEIEWDKNNKYAVANGNPVKIYTNNNSVIMKNLSSGKEINLTEKAVTLVVGGTADGKDIKSTDVFVEDVNYEQLRVYAGSLYYLEGEEIKSATVNSANVKVINSDFYGITGSFYMVHTRELNISVKNSKLVFIGDGRSYGEKGDVNGSIENASLASAMWTLKDTINVDNSEIQYVYGGGNSGYTYTKEVDLHLSNTKITGGICVGGSNGKTDECVSVFDNVEAAQYISVNRGIVNNATSKFKNCKITKLNVITSDEEDTTGTLTGLSSIDCDKGEYHFVLGENNSQPVTDTTNIKYVKVSRSATYSISNDDRAILGDKFIVK